MAKDGRNADELMVISESVIIASIEAEREAADEERRKRGDNTVIARDPVDVVELDSLSLSFKNIVRIEHLTGLENLVHLRLDNNVIKRIENIRHAGAVA